MPLLEVDDVVVQFGGVTAVNHACFVAEAGRVTGLIGPNGAGKTTCFNVISGLQKPDPRHGPLRRPQRHPDAGAPPLQAGDGPHLPAPRGLRVADGPRQRAGRRATSTAGLRGAGPALARGDVDGAARAGRHRGVRRRARRLDPHRHRAAARAGPLPGRRPAAAAARRAVLGPRRDRDRRLRRRCSRDLAAEGRGDPDGRARHGPGDGGLRRDPRARLRPGDRLRRPGRRSAPTRRCRRPTSATPTSPRTTPSSTRPAPTSSRSRRRPRCRR